jgi:hypothetical protein
VWDWIKDWKVREWLTLTFAAIAAVVPWIVHRHSLHKAEKADAANWSISLKRWMTVPSGFIWAELQLGIDANRSI